MERPLLGRADPCGGRPDERAGSVPDGPTSVTKGFERTAEGGEMRREQPWVETVGEDRSDNQVLAQDKLLRRWHFTDFQ